MEQQDPQSSLERELVERLAGILWRLRRVPFFEAAIMEARHHQAGEIQMGAVYSASAETEQDEEEADWHAALHFGLRSRVDDMKERLSRLDLRASKKRELALHAMSEAGLTKLEQPDFTASTRAGSPAVVVISEQTIPPTYWLPQPPKLDRQGLLGELKRGAAIPGAELSNPKPVLMVRTK